MKLLLIITAFIALGSCRDEGVKVATVENDSANYTTIRWLDSVKNIGGVNAGTKTEIRFRFKNTGTKPLFIIAAHPGCGCTIADYPKEAIAPNAEGVITAEFNAAKGTQGEFRKDVMVAANTKGTKYHYLFFYGNVKKDKEG
jgi:hypothetical protein